MRNSFDWTDVTSLFGAMDVDLQMDPFARGHPEFQIDVPKDVFNDHVGVFHEDDFARLVEGMRDRYHAGLPLVVRLRLPVRQNVAQGVQGGYEADTIWVFNGGHGFKGVLNAGAVPPAHTWAGQLPAACLDEVRSLSSSCGFPYMPTISPIYQAREVSCLAQLSAYSLQHPDTKAMLDDMLAMVPVMSATLCRRHCH